MAENTNALRLTAIRPTDTDGGRISPGHLNGYTRLAAGILAQAAKDAQAGHGDAATWLLSEQAEFLAGAVGLSYTHVQRWARRFVSC